MSIKRSRDTEDNYLDIFGKILWESMTSFPKMWFDVSRQYFKTQRIMSIVRWLYVSASTMSFTRWFNRKNINPAKLNCIPTYPEHDRPLPRSGREFSLFGFETRVSRQHHGVRLDEARNEAGGEVAEADIRNWKCVTWRMKLSIGSKLVLLILTSRVKVIFNVPQCIWVSGGRIASDFVLLEAPSKWRKQLSQSVL